MKEANFPTIRSAGYLAYLDAFAIEPDPDKTNPISAPHLLSFVGPPEVAEAIMARLMMVKHAYVHHPLFEGSVSYTRYNKCSYGKSFRSASNNTLHVVAVSGEVISGEVLIERTPKRLRRLLHQALETETNFPIHDLWLDWFIRLLVDNEHLVPLKTSPGLYGYRMYGIKDFQETAFVALKDALRNGVIENPASQTTKEAA